ncbi:META domain-containing protein [Accumulibacter sp.]|uniref:META domain-containing protein n=1 Tax=Accumulibacter sp. TaxID=2053492 RepID=UPI0025F233F6|nr:META domain-containing protein [Accumulibacter sp.]MCM8597021.1 META domain-containing protein [Accumulibacter sp.]MCM8626233.1 META domain-containing protein [Accumulibacter sp.]MDS4051170.1 META domain-containing protein [Accumulibacter sp.]
MKRLLMALAAVLTAGIAQADGDPLAGTSWQLVAIRSMDDAQGVTQVPDPGRFTLSFGRDGRVAFRLDCNRGTGDYTVMPASDGTSGSISFGPIAATRALCPPPHVDERVARDMAHVRGYLLEEGRLYLSLMADGGIYEWAPRHTAGTAQDQDRIVRPVHFAKGSSETILRDRIAGRQYVDYQVRAGAGQRLVVKLEGGHGANTFNLLPPGSTGVAMAIGEFAGNRFDGLLPDDGIYTIRVFLVPAAVRRHEASDYTLSVGITGTPLQPVSARVDAVLPGTRYHARATTRCEPLHSPVRECEASVVRRGFDGTATVDLRWDADSRRRILFVRGEPKAADTAQAMTFSRNESGWRVSFDGEEHFDIPGPLVYGG